MKTYSDVKAAIDKLQARAEELRQSEKAGVISRIREAIAVYEITAAELGLDTGSSRAGGRGAGASGKVQVGVPKYRDPASGRTWTGRGKPPLWIVGVKDRDAYLINGAGRGAADAADKRGRGGKRKAGASNAGVPKYRDPLSGKTWTGRGKPPLWIVGAKDRDAFLIGAGEAGAPSAAEARRGARRVSGSHPA
jgi:DNA-binding protein H-NS